MFQGNERLLKTGKVTQTSNKGMSVDNNVLSTVEHKYSLMDQQHARIRAEALATGRHSEDRRQNQQT